VFANDVRRGGLTVSPAADSIQRIDPPEHAQLREELVRGIRGQPWPAIRRDLPSLAAESLRSAVGRGPVDLIGAAIEPFALRIALCLTGLPPPADGGWFTSVCHAIVDSMDALPGSAAAAAGTRARDELSQWIASASAGDGLLARLSGSGPVGGSRQALNTTRVVLHSAFESISRFAGIAAWLVLSDPRGLDGFRQAQAGLAVEELARHAAPVQGETRLCLARTTLAGTTINAGDYVTALIGSANFDELVFQRPGQLDYRRSPNPHLSFGKGIHACPGMPVAKAAAAAFLTGLCATDARLAAPPAYRPNATLRGLARLDVTLDAR
jgi:cytochrome P450